MHAHMQVAETELREREAAAQRAQNEAEFARAEAAEHVRSVKEESAAVSAKLEALSDARAAAAAESQQREAALAARVRNLKCSFL